MKLTRGKNVTPKPDIAKEEEGIRAIEEAARKPRKSYSLFDASLSDGDIKSFAMVRPHYFLQNKFKLSPDWTIQF